MKNRKLLIVFMALALIVTLAGCVPAKPVSTGAFTGTTYSNDFFNMSFKIPDGWSIASKDDMATIFQAGEDLVGSDDKQAEQKMELAKQKTLYLAFVSKHPYGYTGGNNSNMNVICENLSLASLFVRTSSDYAKAALDTTEKTLADSSAKYTHGDITTQKINGADFAIVDAVLTMQGVDVPERMICTLKNGYAIVFTLTYFQDDDLADLQSIVDSISFK